MSVKDSKSLLVTYLLWLLAGVWGVHHFYLGRDRHAFITWMSLGGYFGFGWLRDLWRIPEYVRDYNQDKDYLEHLTKKMQKQSQPETGLVRHSASIIIADILGYLAIGAIPDELLPNVKLVKPYLCALLVPLAVSIGVHTVGNVGRHKGAFKHALTGAYLTAPLYLWSQNSVFWSSLASNYTFNKYGKTWRRTPKSKSTLLKRVTTLFVCGLLYASLWGSWLYFNCSIEDKNGEDVKCREAAKNFFKSPAWKEFTQVWQDLKLYYQIHGWKGLWKEIVEAFDPQGEANALQVLDLGPSATQEEITARYRKLSREWHPDKHKTTEKKLEAQERFIEIQQAYEVLSHIKAQRLQKNRKGRGSTGGEEEESHQDL